MWGLGSLGLGSCTGASGESGAKLGELERHRVAEPEGARRGPRAGLGPYLRGLHGSPAVEGCVSGEPPRLRGESWGPVPPFLPAPWPLPSAWAEGSERTPLALCFVPWRVLAGVR